MIDFLREVIVISRGKFGKENFSAIRALQHVLFFAAPAVDSAEGRRKAGRLAAPLGHVKSAQSLLIARESPKKDDRGRVEYPDFFIFRIW